MNFNRQDTLSSAKSALGKNKVAIFIVTYNAEQHIQNVISRIPDWILKDIAEIYIIDDCSTDDTRNVVMQFCKTNNYPINLFKTNVNQGYGGNQKLGFLYALEKNFDIVILLHGDGQYAPESLPDILAEYEMGAEVVFGTRFAPPLAALSGGMPLYKWLGNLFLTSIKNKILKLEMSEMHSGYRSYRTSVLKKIPFLENSNDFAFDIEMIIQLTSLRVKINEVSIPTFYGKEISHVNSVVYGIQSLVRAIKYRLGYGGFLDLSKFGEVKFENSIEYLRKLSKVN